jgi:hypothetical protein
MKNTRRLTTIIFITAAVVYILLGMPGIIKTETIVTEETIGYRTGIEIPKLWLIAGLLVALLIYRFRPER